MSTIPPRILARADQERARVADLVDQVHQHQQHCDLPGICPGTRVANTLYDLGCDDLEALITTALLVLAETRTTNQKGPSASGSEH